MNRFPDAGAIKVGVVGYGGAFNMGRAHLNEMKRAGMTPVAVAEIDPARLAVAEEDFPGIGTFPNLAAMLRRSEVNLITLITPHNTHAKLGLQALRAGRHVVCEKPMAITTAECDALISAAKKNRVVVSTYHNRHWDGRIRQAVADVVDDRRIGDIVRVEAHMGGRRKPGDWWRSSRSISGGILYDWGVHLLEYSLQLVRSEIVEVSGFAKRGYWGPQTRWREDANEDEGFAVVRFRNGVVLTLLVSSLDSNPKRGWVELVGTEGNYLIDGPGNECIRRDGDTLTTTTSNLADESWRFYQNFADHLTGREKLVITPEWARRPIHILDLANRSARIGRSLKATYR